MQHPEISMNYSIEVCDTRSFNEASYPVASA